MKRAALAAVLLLAVTAAHAAKHLVQWIPPTENTNGTPLTDLAGFQIVWGDCQGTKTPVGNALGSIKVGNPTVVAASFTGPSDVCIVAYAYNAALVMSDPTNVVRTGGGNGLPTPGQPQPLPTPGPPVPISPANLTPAH